MAFDAQGNWTPEDDSVAPRVAAITSKDSTLMRQAASMGTRSANRRGLMNSSMGIGAAHSAVLGAATPIASQEAQQIATKNLAFMEGKNQREINTANLAAAERERQLAALTNLVTNSQSSIAGTLQNHEIPGATRAAVQQSINDQTAAAIAAMERLYGTRINWGTLNPAITSQPGGAVGIGGGYGAGTGVRV